jgi:hypothetical protein
MQGHPQNAPMTQMENEGYPQMAQMTQMNAAANAGD